MNQSEQIEKVNKLIHGIKIAMLTTINPGGTLHSRPMATQESDFDGDLWFFTDWRSTKVDEVKAQQHVNLSYADPSDNRFVSVSGTAEVVRNQEKAKELWNLIYKAWFPQGLEDPNIALLKVSVEKVEYWDSPSGKMVQAIGFVKALATGKRYEASQEEHDTVKLA